MRCFGRNRIYLKINLTQINMINYILLFLLFPGISFAQHKWVLEKNTKDIQVYVRDIEGSSFQEVMVKMQCKGTLAELKNVLMDIDQYEDWVYNTKESKVLKKLNHNEVIYYTEFHIPWPADNRDLVAHVTFVTDSIPNIYFINSKAVTTNHPEKSGVVRIINSRTTWKIIQSNPDQLDIEYIIRVDPGGSLPAWVVNMSNITGPYNSFVNLKELLD